MRFSLIKPLDTVRDIIKKENKKVENIINITIIVSFVVFILSLVLKFLFNKYGY